ncbi:MAG: Nif3-like dinuclear metal center hexameric protein, partial [bacterium]
MAIELATIVSELDTYFNIANWPEDPAMKDWVPKVYARAGYDYQEVFEPGFCEKFNGLMLRAGTDVKKVFCSAFATPDIMKSILDSDASDALLFLHHPVDMEVCGVGFLPIPASVIAELRKRKISIYGCHAPLDCHDEIGTNAAIVQALGVTVDKSYIEYGLGYAGRMGSIKCEKISSLLKKIRDIFGVSRLEVGGCLNTEVRRIAIVAGGGDELDHLEQAHANSCDMYLTGEWYPRYTPEDITGKERIARMKEEISEFSRNTRMVLVGVSHAASEFLVMKTQ